MRQQFRDEQRGASQAALIMTGDVIDISSDDESRSKTPKGPPMTPKRSATRAQRAPLGQQASPPPQTPAGRTARRSCAAATRQRSLARSLESITLRSSSPFNTRAKPSRAPMVQSLSTLSSDPLLLRSQGETVCSWNELIPYRTAVPTGGTSIWSTMDEDMGWSCGDQDDQMMQVSRDTSRFLMNVPIEVPQPTLETQYVHE